MTASSYRLILKSQLTKTTTKEIKYLLNINLFFLVRNTLFRMSSLRSWVKRCFIHYKHIFRFLEEIEQMPFIPTVSVNGESIVDDVDALKKSTSLTFKRIYFLKRFEIGRMSKPYVILNLGKSDSQKCFWGFY